MTKKLFVSAITKFTAGVILLALLLFLPAGTIHYPGGWLLMGILFIPMFLAGLVMMATNPNLLRSRLNAKEKEREQDLVIKLSGLMFLVGFILAGLDFRFGWSRLPGWVSILGAVLFLTAYASTPRYCGKTPGCPGLWKYRRARVWWIPACTASSAILCTQ